MKNSDSAVLTGENNYIKNKQQRNYPSERNNKSRFYFLGIVAGILSAVGMALLTIALTQVGTISAPVIMFVKYLILGIALSWILASQRRALGKTYKFVKGIRLGGLVTFASAITIAFANSFLYSVEAKLENGNPTDPSSPLGGALINGGVTFMECLVFGMILTFICLQFLKRGREGEQNT